jgi:hypothetical protein
MELRQYLTAVATDYDRADGLNSPTQQLIRRAAQELASVVPAGMLMKSGGGKGTPTFTPWVGFFDPDETSEPQEGMYLVYIFSADLASVALTLNQGMERLRKKVGDKEARAALTRDALAIRGALAPGRLTGLDGSINLGMEKGDRQKNYEAGNIAAIRYDIAALPTQLRLEQDLERMLALYSDALDARTRLLLTDPGVVSAPSGSALGTGDDPLRHFKPKDDGDYFTYLTTRMLRKTRRHETLVRRYGEWCSTQGYVPATPHPRDLVLTRAPEEWLVEAKVLYQGNATEAVRAAVGQLLSYRHFLYTGGSSPHLLAAFSEPVGDAYVEFLSSCGIEAVWWQAGLWVGTPAAVSENLAELDYA